MAPMQFRVRTSLIVIASIAFAVGAVRFALTFEITRLSVEIGQPNLLVLHLWSGHYLTQRGTEAVSIDVSLQVMFALVGVLAAFGAAFLRSSRVRRERVSVNPGPFGTPEPPMSELESQGSVVAEKA